MRMTQLFPLQTVLFSNIDLSCTKIELMRSRVRQKGEESSEDFPFDAHRLEDP